MEIVMCDSRHWRRHVLLLLLVVVVLLLECSPSPSIGYNDLGKAVTDSDSSHNRFVHLSDTIKCVYLHDYVVRCSKHLE